MGRILFSIFTFVLFIAGCSNLSAQKDLGRTGLLVQESINDQVWGTKGYRGLLKIQEVFNHDVFYKEGIETEEMAERETEGFAEKNVSLIFGHGNEFAHYFNQFAEKYPDIHFVSFNGDAIKPNTTSLSFEGYAMGFFGGMTAAYMSASKTIGIIAAFEWQLEVEGFIEGATVQYPDIEVLVQFTGDWDDSELAAEKLDELINQGTDVIYPAGDGYNVPVIEEIKEKGLFAIGYVSDQSDLGESTVLTSTVQHVDKLYELVAKKYIEGTRESGNLYFDFQDGVISMGTYSPLVDQKFQNKMNRYVDHYIKTGELPTLSNL